MLCISLALAYYTAVLQPCCFVLLHCCHRGRPEWHRSRSQASEATVSAGIFGYAPIAGSLSIACAATGLSLTLGFKDSAVVEGQVEKQLGPRCVALAHISGRWTEQILVQSAAKQAHELPLQGVAASILPT